jgi:hypothetical protein
VPELGASLGVAVRAFLLDPHRGRQHQVGGQCGERRVGIGDDDEVVRVAVTGPGLLVEVRRRLDVVVAHHPVGVELAVLEHAVLQHGVEADLAGDGPLGQLPFLLGERAVRRLGDHHVGRQAVGEGADLTRGATGQRERAVARLRDLAGQQVDVVHQVVHPGAAGVLVEAHGPVRDHLAARVGVEFGERLEVLGRHPGELADRVDVVVGDERGELVEIDLVAAAGLLGVGRLLL